MSVSRTPGRALCSLVVLAASVLPVALACSTDNGGTGTIAPGPSIFPGGFDSTGNGAGQTAGSTPSGTGTAGGTSTQGGNSAQAGMTSAAGTPAAAGNGGSPSAGASGAATTGGSGGATNGGMGGIEPGDTPPDRPLKVDTSLGEHKHDNAGLDTRAKLLGKLVVDVGVNSGGYSSFLAKRGYHSLGAPCGSCDAPNLGAGRDTVGNCRLQEFATTEASVTTQLKNLQSKYPEEDWGYFLTKDGNVRWSDVAITGISHGATTAAIAGRLGARMWRVVSRSGPRDNTCGKGDGKCTAPISTPAYDENCPDSEVASWLDKESKTPISRFYGIVGMSDGQCGDIMFNMHRTQYPGMPVIFDVPNAVLTGTNQFFSMSQGHYDFLAAPGGAMNTPLVLEIAFGIPEANRNPNF